MELQQLPPTVQQEQISKQNTTKKFFDEIDKEASRLLEEQRKKTVEKNKEDLNLFLAGKYNEMESKITEFLINKTSQTNQKIKELEENNSRLSQKIELLFTQNKNQQICQNNRLSLISFCTALGLSLNFILLAYLWHYTHK